MSTPDNPADARGGNRGRRPHPPPCRQRGYRRPPHERRADLAADDAEREVRMGQANATRRSRTTRSQGQLNGAAYLRAGDSRTSGDPSPVAIEQLTRGRSGHRGALRLSTPSTPGRRAPARNARSRGIHVGSHARSAPPSLPGGLHSAASMAAEESTKFPTAPTYAKSADYSGAATRRSSW